MKKLWGKIVFQIKRVPWYGWVAGIVMLALNTAFYAIAKVVINNWSIAWAVQPKIPGIDGKIPFCAYFWIEIYLFSFLFWLFGPIVASVSKKDRFMNYIFTLLAAYIVCFLIYIFAPTFTSRVDEGIMLENGQYGPLIENMNNGLSKFLYKCMLFFDGDKTSTNLLPSLHCMLSVFCYLAISRNKDISLGSRIYAITLAVLISLATLFTKQHYVVDVFSGWALAFILWYVMILINPGQRLCKKYPNLFVIKKKPNRNLQKKK